jgi:hypothetical protein
MPNEIGKHGTSCRITRRRIVSELAEMSITGGRNPAVRRNSQNRNNPDHGRLLGSLALLQEMRSKNAKEADSGIRKYSKPKIEN